MATFDKAKTRNQPKRKWYVVGKSGYYIWALPLVPFVLGIEKIHDYRYNRMKWNEARATKILDYVLPQVLEWIEEDKAYYYCMDWTLSPLYKKAHLIDKKWANKFKYNLQDYLKDGYENSNYSKIIENDWETIWIKFQEKT